jgi:hypothetical protein
VFADHSQDEKSAGQNKSNYFLNIMNFDKDILKMPACTICSKNRQGQHMGEKKNQEKN